MNKIVHLYITAFFTYWLVLCYTSTGKYIKQINLGTDF